MIEKTTTSAETSTETAVASSDFNLLGGPLPRPDFLASPATRWDGPLGACSRLWDGYALDCPVLASTPLKDAPWATLHVYMQRRFGLGHLGADDYKDIGAGWLLTTPDPKVFVEVCPSLNGAGFSFTPRIADRDVQEQLQRSGPSISPERIETIKSAYRATLLDLLRPVCVRDQFINALGEVDDDDELLRYDEDAEETNFEVKRHPSSGYAMPVGLFGGKDWAVLCHLLDQLGDGDMTKGRQAAIEQLQQPVLDEIARASWSVQRLVLLGSPDAEGLAPRLALSPAALATFASERNALALEKLPALVDEMTDTALKEATAFLARLGYGDGDLPGRVESLRVRKAVEQAWTDLVAIAKDDFPNAALPENTWGLGAELPSAFKAGLREHGREDLANWVDRTMERAGGLWALQQITAHLIAEVAEQAKLVAKPDHPRN